MGKDQRGLMRHKVLLCGFLGALVIAAFTSAQGRGLNPTTARQAMSQKLANRFGNEFVNATAVWVKCPKQEILNFSGNRFAICMAEFGRNRSRHLIVGRVDETLQAYVDYTRRWNRHFRPCPRRFLRRLNVRGSLSANDNNCGGTALMAADVAYWLSRGKFHRHEAVYAHGTNRVGFEQWARFPCKRKNFGQRISVTCRNSLGDAFRYRVRGNAFPASARRAAVAATSAGTWPVTPPETMTIERGTGAGLAALRPITRPLWPPRFLP
jgi:hypothetical protein